MNGNIQVTLDGMEEPMLGGKELMENCPRVGSSPPAVMSLGVRSGAVTKVQSDFLKLGSSHHELTLNLKHRAVGLYPMKQQPEGGEALNGRTLFKKQLSTKIPKSEVSGQGSYCPVQDK